MRIAFVFPGQGSQSVGMLDGFESSPAAADVLARAGEALGFSIEKMIKEGPIEDLGLTINTQPAMLTASAAMYAAWLELGGPKPEMMAGHSLGEYSALTAAGAIKLEDAVKLVRFRAEAMQSAVPVGVGGMAAIMGLEDEVVEEVCAEAREVGPVEAVNFNAPGQVVVAGVKAAVEKAVELAKEKGCRRAMTLAVSAPFHSSLLQPAADALAARLEEVEFSECSVPVVANVDCAVHGDAASIRSRLARQAASPVQWVNTIRAMKEAGITDIVECGPGKVLTGLLKRTEPSIAGHNVKDVEGMKALIEKLTATS